MQCSEDTNIDPRGNNLDLQSNETRTNHWDLFCLPNFENEKKNMLRDNGKLVCLQRQENILWPPSPGALRFHGLVLLFQICINTYKNGIHTNTKLQICEHMTNGMLITDMKPGIFRTDFETRTNDYHDHMYLSARMIKFLLSMSMQSYRLNN